MSSPREEIRALLDLFAGKRPAALRRSLSADYLYATDLPAAAGEEKTAAFRDAAELAGWRTERSGAWILLDREVHEMPEALRHVTGGTEAEACGSLLRRHTGGCTEETGILTRRLIKAAEEGTASYRQVCGEIHARMAEKLRKGEPLPDLSLTFFENENSAKENDKC